LNKEFVAGMRRKRESTGRGFPLKKRVFASSNRSPRATKEPFPDTKKDWPERSRHSVTFRNVNPRKEAQKEAISGQGFYARVNTRIALGLKD